MTISLVPEAKGGPFVFWDDLQLSASKAAQLGYSAIEIFAPAPAAINQSVVGKVLAENKLSLAALGTGAGWVKHRLSLSAADKSIRVQAMEFILKMVEAAAPFKAAVIIGSMQGKFEGNISREQALAWLQEGLAQICDRAKSSGVPVLYEPLNRYETNLLNRLEDVVPFLRAINAPDLRILADLFHMNMEERSIPEALEAAGDLLGHLHFVDSNRRPAGLGHIDFEPIFSTLRRIGYNGYVSAEAFPWPDSDQAAAQTIQTYRRFVTGNGS